MKAPPHRAWYFQREKERHGPRAKDSVTSVYPGVFLVLCCAGTSGLSWNRLARLRVPVWGVERQGYTSEAGREENNKVCTRKATPAPGDGCGAVGGITYCLRAGCFPVLPAPSVGTTPPCGLALPGGASGTSGRPGGTLTFARPPEGLQ